MRPRSRARREPRSRAVNLKNAVAGDEEVEPAVKRRAVRFAHGDEVASLRLEGPHDAERSCVRMARVDAVEVGARRVKGSSAPVHAPAPAKLNDELRARINRHRSGRDARGAEVRVRLPAGRLGRLPAADEKRRAAAREAHAREAQGIGRMDESLRLTLPVRSVLARKRLDAQGPSHLERAARALEGAHLEPGALVENHATARREPEVAADRSGIRRIRVIPPHALRAPHLENASVDREPRRIKRRVVLDQKPPARPDRHLGAVGVRIRPREPLLARDHPRAERILLLLGEALPGRRGCGRSCRCALRRLRIRRGRQTAENHRGRQPRGAKKHSRRRFADLPVRNVHPSFLPEAAPACGMRPQGSGIRS